EDADMKYTSSPNPSMPAFSAPSRRHRRFCARSWARMLFAFGPHFSVATRSISAWIFFTFGESFGMMNVAWNRLGWSGWKLVGWNSDGNDRRTFSSSITTLLLLSSQFGLPAATGGALVVTCRFRFPRLYG